MVEIKMSITPELITSIASDLKASEKIESEAKRSGSSESAFTLSSETKVFLQTVLKTSLAKCERLQPEVDTMIDACVHAAEMLS